MDVQLELRRQRAAGEALESANRELQLSNAQLAARVAALEAETCGRRVLTMLDG